MKKLLGIGTAGCNVVEQLSQYPVYECYYISNEINKTSKYKFALPVCDGPEEYESLDATKLLKWIGKITDSCTVMLCGGSDSTGITLKALEKLHKNGAKLDVVYFAPEAEVLSETKILHERAASGILQNFARSGLFEKICLVSNVALEELAGSTNVFDYFNQINHVFTSTYYMLDVFKNTKPIISTFKKPRESCRITTIGLSSIDGEERLFFPFQSEVDVIYYYGINENKLKQEENLFRTITNKVKQKITQERKVSFGVYPTQYEDDYIYVELFSPKIQEIISE
ncbi:MAG TPA: hypothetical protein DCM40_42990 [Maribacter sp.]|nr:hypothetical protein [Maribacter sp.]